MVPQEAGFPSSQLSLICCCHNSEIESGITRQILHQKDLKNRCQIYNSISSLDIFSNNEVQYFTGINRHFNPWFPSPYPVSLLIPVTAHTSILNYYSRFLSTIQAVSSPWITLISKIILKYVFCYLGYSCYSISKMSSFKAPVKKGHFYGKFFSFP